MSLYVYVVSYRKFKLLPHVSQSVVSLLRVFRLVFCLLMFYLKPDII